MATNMDIDNDRYKVRCATLDSLQDILREFSWQLGFDVNNSCRLLVNPSPSGRAGNAYYHATEDYILFYGESPHYFNNCTRDIRANINHNSGRMFDGTDAILFAILYNEQIPMDTILP